MNKSTIKYEKRDRRHMRIRAKISGTAEMPRLSVYKSNKQMYAQVIDDTNGTTLVAITTQKISGKGMLEKAKTAGIEIAKLALSKKIKNVVFDRGGFIYTGQIKALADGAREGGLTF
ncbi:MAG: 50S ribosomal protein L18 [bacterium]|nr:50S ribosomal protein L18 [bacterium]